MRSWEHGDTVEQVDDTGWVASPACTLSTCPRPKASHPPNLCFLLGSEAPSPTRLKAYGVSSGLPTPSFSHSVTPSVFFSLWSFPCYHCFHSAILPPGLLHWHPYGGYELQGHTPSVHTPLGLKSGPSRTIRTIPVSHDNRSQKLPWLR